MKPLPRAGTGSKEELDLEKTEADSWPPKRLLDFHQGVITRDADVLQVSIRHLRQEISLPRPRRPSCQDLREGFEPFSQYAARLPYWRGGPHGSRVRKVYRHCIPRSKAAAREIGRPSISANENLFIARERESSVVGAKPDTGHCSLGFRCSALRARRLPIRFRASMKKGHFRMRGIHLEPAGVAAISTPAC
jgi:hypothetical protein